MISCKLTNLIQKYYSYDLKYLIETLHNLVFLLFIPIISRHLTGYLWELFLGFVYVIQVTQMSILGGPIYWVVCTTSCVCLSVFHEKAYAQKYIHNKWCSCLCKRRFLYVPSYDLLQTCNYCMNFFENRR